MYKVDPEGHSSKIFINSFFVIASLLKAFFIVGEFMHVRYETRALTLTILVPLVFLIWFIIAFLWEGAEWLDNRVRFNAAVFTNDYTDIQIAQFEAGSGGASSRIVNAGQGRIGYRDSTQRLFYVGVIDVATRDALKAVAGVSAAFQQAVDALYGAQRLANHAETLRSAFNLTADEYEQIIAALGYDAGTVLTLSNVSAIFRRGWLARKLKLSVRELLLLIEITGLDPFAMPDPTDPALWRLIALLQALRDRSLPTEAALYLVWNQDLSGKSAPAPATLAELARTLRSDFVATDESFATTEAGGGEQAVARMALVYGPQTSDAFFALLDETQVVDVGYTHPAPVLENAITAVDAKLKYDHFLHRLSYTGLLTAAKRDALKLVAGVPNDFQTAVQALYDRGEEIKGRFFTRYPELLAPYTVASAAAPADQTAAG